MMNIEDMTAREALEWACNIIFELCEETENDPSLLRIAEGDPEGKVGAFAQGRMHEAMAIRCAVAGARRLLLTAGAEAPKAAQE